MINLGRTNYWFTGERFFFGDRERQRDLTDEDREPLLRYLCSCAFGLNRWQGEANEHSERFSVGDHSILVAALAGRLAMLRGHHVSAIATCVRLGAVHDLGETLGLGDIAAPWLRYSRGGDLRDWCEGHQRYVTRLARIDPADAIAFAGLIKDADHLAAALERRCFFGDYGGDMEHPDVPRLIAEVFDGNVESDGNELCNLVYPSDEEILLGLILGRSDIDSTFVLGEHLMIRNGKAVGP